MQSLDIIKSKCPNAGDFGEMGHVGEDNSRVYLQRKYFACI